MNHPGTLVGAMILVVLGLASSGSSQVADPAVKPPWETAVRRDTGPAAGPSARRDWNASASCVCGGPKRSTTRAGVCRVIGSPTSIENLPLADSPLVVARQPDDTVYSGLYHGQTTSGSACTAITTRSCRANRSARPWAAGRRPPTSSVCRPRAPLPRTDAGASSSRSLARRPFPRGSVWSRPYRPSARKGRLAT